MTRPHSLRYATALMPAVVLVIIAILIDGHHQKADRAQRFAEFARIAAASVDLRPGEFVRLASFCMTSPALIVWIDFDNAAENCGRYAARMGAWSTQTDQGHTEEGINHRGQGAPARRGTLQDRRCHPRV